jgi:hypothetical protein
MCTLSWSTAQVNQTDAQGKKHGEWIVYYEGSSVPRYKGQFEHGKPVGKFVHYYPTSVVKMIILMKLTVIELLLIFTMKIKRFLHLGFIEIKKKIVFGRTTVQQEIYPLRKRTRMMS